MATLTPIDPTLAQYCWFNLTANSGLMANSVLYYWDPVTRAWWTTNGSSVQVDPLISQYIGPVPQVYDRQSRQRYDLKQQWDRNNMRLRSTLVYYAKAKYGLHLAEAAGVVNDALQYWEERQDEIAYAIRNP
jgi:hypothetical protein